MIAIFHNKCRVTYARLRLSRNQSVVLLAFIQSCLPPRKTANHPPMRSSVASWHWKREIYQTCRPTELAQVLLLHSARPPFHFRCGIVTKLDFHNLAAGQKITSAFSKEMLLPAWKNLATKLRWQRTLGHFASFLHVKRWGELTTLLLDTVIVIWIFARSRCCLNNRSQQSTWTLDGACLVLLVHTLTHLFIFYQYTFVSGKKPFLTYSNSLYFKHCVAC